MKKNEIFISKTEQIVENINLCNSLKAEFKLQIQLEFRRCKTAQYHNKNEKLFLNSSKDYKMPKTSWNSDKILSISAMFISVLTLMVFIYQTRLIRKQQYLSVYPYMTYGTGGEGTGENKLHLANTGIGPALIKDVSISYKRNKFTYIYEFVDFLSERDSSLNLYYSDITSGLLIPADVNKVIIGSANDNTDKLYDILTDDFQLIIEYESIYGEKWTVSSSEEMPGFGLPNKD